MDKIRQIDKWLVQNFGKYNIDRFQNITNQTNLLQECEQVRKTELGIEYYKHLITNTQLEPQNTNNSYIMWLYNKVDGIDLSQPVTVKAGSHSLPDIDVDFPKAYREELIQYLRDKYGADKVCQIITFGRMQGRSALKEVFRVHNACSYEEMNEITQILPGEAEIADKMDEDDEKSIIQWTLEHDPGRSNGEYRLSDYCTYKDGKYEGDYAQYFEQAVRIEGTFKSSGKHAAGVVISKVPLATVCPMINDSKGVEKIAGIEQKDLEAMGHVKFDILAVALLDRLMYVNELEKMYG